MTVIDQAPALMFREARTANTFSDEPVSDEQMQAIYELVKWAPTSMNQRPLRIVLVRTEEGRRRLVGHLAEGNRAKTQSAPRSRFSQPTWTSRKTAEGVPDSAAGQGPLPRRRVSV